MTESEASAIDGCATVLLNALFLAIVFGLVIMIACDVRAIRNHMDEQANPTRKP